MSRGQTVHTAVAPELTHLSLFTRLGAELANTDTEVEFYFVGGAVMLQAFTAAPGTAHVSAIFQPSRVVREAVRTVTESVEGIAHDWVHRAVVGLLGGGKRTDAYIELEHVSVFAPLPEYVLAVKCAAMRLGDEFQELDDVRYVLRAMNVTSVDEALSIVSRYFTERQLAPETRDRLSSVLEG